MSRINRLRLAIVTNEVLDAAISRTGGFGFAAMSVARLFQALPELGVDPILVACERMNVPAGRRYTMSCGTELVPYQTDHAAWLNLVREISPHLLLTIDYRPTYDPVLNALPRTPAAVWVRDPRTWDDYSILASLRLPGSPDPDVPGLGAGPVRGLRAIVVRSWLRGRRIRLCPTTPYLRSKLRGCYGVPEWRSPVLPNIIDPAPQPIRKALTPTVVFLGRMDPCKRPWLVLEIARRMPDVAFVMLGKNHFEGAWTPTDVPPNVTIAGHVEGSEKQAHLSRAWILLNTSIHEGLAVSFLEALAAEASIVSCQDPEGLATSYGRYVGRWNGDGLASVTAFVAALGELVGSPEATRSLGRQGRQWLEKTHGRSPFLAAFADIRSALAVG
jgi:glycosyltransferase involved in cell wall biosynthesis